MLVALWAVATPASAGDVASAARADFAEVDFAPGSHERFAKRVNAAQEADYRAVLAAYDARGKAHPADVLSRIERCRFVEIFANLEEPTIESASDDFDACLKDLREGPHATNVDVILYGVESSWSDEDTKAAQDLIPKSRAWTKAQRATLFELLAQRHHFTDETRGAGYAIQAVDLDPGSRVLLQAVHRWVQLGAKAKARRAILEAPANTWERVSRTEAAQVLIDMDDAVSASRLLREAPAADRPAGSDLALARALTVSGELEAARQCYRDAFARSPYVTRGTREEYFVFERDHGTGQDAASAYEALRKEGLAADPVARHRLSLFLARPLLAWQWRDVPGILALIGTVLAFGLVPLLVIVPVHYRGLAIRASGRVVEPGAAPWSLSEAWFATAAYTLAGFAALYVLAPTQLEAMLPWANRFVVAPPTDRVLARVLLWSAIGGLVLLAPLLRGRSAKSLLCGTWSTRQSLFAGLGAALLLKGAAVILMPGPKGLGVLGSDTTRAIQGAAEAYGLGFMLLLVAVVIPVVEELVFRGAMLGAFRAHVPFSFATIAQATAFTLVHEEWQSMPFLFVFALVAAWLAKASQGLLAPMVMHGTNNLLAGLAIVGLTKILNR
jgi:membrane protease YdiL (CAAX protease family)